jgi:hypothetical protein
MRRLIATVVCALALIFGAAPARGAFTFDDIQYWVGTGTNSAALTIDWSYDSTTPPALVWGYRWDGQASGRDMLLAIVTADDRLFAKFGGSAGPVFNPDEFAIYGFGYDANSDGQFAIDDGTVFDSQSGIVDQSGPADGAKSIDPADYYKEGWFTGFWHYGVATSDPYNGGVWTDSPTGVARRTLVNGEWDSLAFQSSTTPPFTTYANNPQAAVAPITTLPGDFNGDGRVDADDFSVWKSAFGLTTQLVADGNHDGIVDAADYAIWRSHLSTASATSSTALGVAEPSSLSLALCSLCALCLVYLVHRKERV